MDKFLMPRYVYKGQPCSLLIDIWCKTQVDGDSPPLLLFEPVGVNSRQGFDQKGLAMIDMSTGTDYEFQGIRAEGMHQGMSTKMKIQRMVL